MVRRAVRSEPAPGSVRAKAESRSPLASLRQDTAASARACRTSGAGRPRRCSRGPRPARRRSASTVAILVRNGANAENGAPWPPYSRIDQQAPVAGRGQVVEDRRRRSCRRSSSSVPASRWRRTTASDSSITRRRPSGDRRRLGAGTGRPGPRGPRPPGGPGCGRSGTGWRTAPRPARRRGRACPSSAPPPRSCRRASARSRRSVWRFRFLGGPGVIGAAPSRDPELHDVDASLARSGSDRPVGITSVAATGSRRPAGRAASLPG